MPSDTPLAAMSDEELRARVAEGHSNIACVQDEERFWRMWRDEAAAELSRRERRSATSTTDAGRAALKDGA